MTDTFAALEAMEFGGAPERALDGYRTLADHREPRVRAGALVRLGRVQRKTQDFAGALVTYQRLAELGAVRTDDLPAELAGLTGQRSTYIAMSAPEQANDIGRRMLRGLDSGRWLIDARHGGTLSRAVHGTAAGVVDARQLRSARCGATGRPPVDAGPARVRRRSRDRGRVCSCCGDRTARTARRSRRSADRFFDVPAAKPRPGNWSILKDV